MTDETQDEYERILDGADPLAKLHELALVVNEHYYDVGCIVYHLKENDIYKMIDGKKYYSDKHTKWKQFCEDNLSISYRTAQYWLNLYRYFSEMGISRDKLGTLGWSKAKELIDITEDAADLDRIIAAAENMTIQELQAYIADYKVELETGVQAEVVKYKKFGFHLPEMQSEHAEDILRTAQAACDGNLNEGFWKILVEWSQITNPLPVDAENTYLVGVESLDDNGQELPEEVRLLFN